MADLSMTFINYTIATFKLASDPVNMASVDSLLQIPNPVLLQGMQTSLSIDNQTDFGEGSATFSCVWYDPASGLRFGVQIVDGGQPLGIGPQPVWNYMYDQGQQPDSPISWLSSGSTPASVLTWPSSLPYTITGVPVSTHEKLSVSITVSNN